MIFLCSIGTFFYHISFGLGLGDLFGYAFLYFVTIIHLILTFKLRKKENAYIFLSLIFLTLTILICLKATIWRGPLYKWNGSLFYVSCPNQIPIKNGQTEKQILVTMCTGDYEFNFSGKWNGKNIELQKGNVIYPQELKKYINFPIKLINIEKENEGIYGNPHLKDTLQTNKIYHLNGKISKITNGIITIKL